jgi:hypothetical protein
MSNPNTIIINGSLNEKKNLVSSNTINSHTQNGEKQSEYSNN